MSKEANIGCKNADPDLYRVVTVCQEFLTSKGVKFEIDEKRASTVFIYFVHVPKTNLAGYIGRDYKKDKISYVIIDAGRINWALQEGFTRLEAFEKVGVCREATSIDSFIKWITGEKNYKLKGEYIKSVQT